MKPSPRLACLVAIGIGAVLGTVSASAQTYAWQQVWGDEFDYAGAPDPARWGHEIGRLRNDEAQYYTDRLENARVENGHLVIEARKESYLGAAYTSASVHTMSTDRQTVKFSTSGGRLEVRAKLPGTAGCWPAFWTMGADSWTASGGWPKSGEIDIFEYIANTPHVAFGNLHYLGADGYHKDNVAAYDVRSADYLAAPISSGYHTFRVDWHSDRIEWYFDNVKYHTVSIAPAAMSGDPFHRPHYLILNLAMGGSWGSPVDPSFASAQYLVDYVRVSQLVEVPVTYAAWQLGQGIPAGAPPAEDRNANGVADLIDYAIGDSRPAPGLQNGKLSLSFMRSRPAVTYSVECSSDLSTWTTLATNPGTVGALVTVTDTAAATPARFLRLRITL
jgi:beta-glucanase (GH16 family)